MSLLHLASGIALALLVGHGVSAQRLILTESRGDALEAPLGGEPVLSLQFSSDGRYLALHGNAAPVVVAVDGSSSLPIFPRDGDFLPGLAGPEFLIVRGKSITRWNVTAGEQWEVTRIESDAVLAQPRRGTWPRPSVARIDAKSFALHTQERGVLLLDGTTGTTRALKDVAGEPWTHWGFAVVGPQQQLAHVIGETSRVRNCHEGGVPFVDTSVRLEILDRAGQPSSTTDLNGGVKWVGFSPSGNLLLLHSPGGGPDGAQEELALLDLAAQAIVSTAQRDTDTWFEFVTEHAVLTADTQSLHWLTVPSLESRPIEHHALRIPGDATLSPPPPVLYAIALSPKRDRVAVGRRDGRVVVFEIEPPDSTSTRN